MRTGFRHRVRLISINFTTFLKQSQREEAITISKKQCAFLCTLTWTFVFLSRNQRFLSLKREKTTYPTTQPKVLRIKSSTSEQRTAKGN